jgi:hypothetical protein
LGFLFLLTSGSFTRLQDAAKEDSDGGGSDDDGNAEEVG